MPCVTGTRLSWGTTSVNSAPLDRPSPTHSLPLTLPAASLSFLLTTIRYGPTFSSDDVIGCCVNFLDHTCFYTKNGQKLEVAFRDLDRKEVLFSTRA